MPTFRRLAIAAALAPCAFLPSLATAAPAEAAIARMYGAGARFTPEELPPGQLKSRLQTLPAAARNRALHWLHSFSFPAQDLDAIRIDDTGGVFYVDAMRPQRATASVVDGAVVSEALTQAQVFALHSRPGARRVVYLDFDGAVVSGTQWNASAGIASWNAKPFDSDGNPSAFSADELARMHEIWHRVAEDLSAFDIDVTTANPGTLGPDTGWILVTHSDNGTAAPLPSAAAGGVAYINVWGSSYYAGYQPAFVYYNNLGSGQPTYVAEAASHELGHNLGLSHDGTVSGTTYYAGHGSGNVSWAPIMGVGYYNNVTQWSKGEYTDANQLQDDVAIIAGKLGVRADDHANSAGSIATPLDIDAAGRVLASNPELDPANQLPMNKGVLESRDDVDVFVFSTGGGSVDLRVTPAWDAFYRTARRGADVDVSIALLDRAGTPIASADPLDDTFAQISTTLQQGTYYLAVAGAGSSGNYSDYGSLGEYFVNGTIQPDAADTAAPTPDPMYFAAAPAPLGADRIGMSAATATDDRSQVEYQFHCVSGGSGCVDSPWQSSPQWTASGLAPATIYEFQVRARDLAGNTTAWSAGAAAVTATANQPPLAAFGTSCSWLACAFTDRSSDADGTIVAWAWTFGDGGTAGVRDPQHAFGGGGIYNVRLTVTDDRGATASTVQTITVDAPPPPNVPTGMQASDGRNGTALLGWTDRSSDETGFTLQRETLQKNGSWRGTVTFNAAVAGDSATAQAESQVDASGAGTFRYRVRAVSATGFSDWSAWAQVTVSGGSCRNNRCR